jgi:hypothetical protein
MPTRSRSRNARCSVSDEIDTPPPRSLRAVILGAGLLVAALGGAVVARYFAPPQQRSSSARQSRPIVQIVRQQPGLPDLADLIDRLCPSVAVIVPQGEEVPEPSSSAGAVPASVYSADEWLVTSATNLPQGQLDAVFSGGERVDLSDLRTDPVSGLAIVKAAGRAAPPLAFSDEAFPRVGQFGFTLATPAASG